MKISNCKLSKKVQIKLLEFFVLEVTARSAADLLDIQPNSVALYYRKIRRVIRYYLEQDTSEIFDGCVELDESYLEASIRGREAGVQQER
jgi:transposase